MFELCMLNHWPISWQPQQFFFTPVLITKFYCILDKPAPTHRQSKIIWPDLTKVFFFANGIIQVVHKILCFFQRFLEYSGLWPFSVFPCCQCVYTHQAGRTPALQQSSEKSHFFKGKKHNI